MYWNPHLQPQVIRWSVHCSGETLAEPALGAAKHHPDQYTNLGELWFMHLVWERFFPGSDTGCTFGEYIRKKSQKSSILQEDSCRNTALNKEKRNFRKKIQFVPPFSHSKRGTKRRFSHICSFETCKYTDSTEFRRKWMPKSKKFHIVPHYLEQPFQAKYDSP